jgi:DNA-binding HxlR family transcriptional regulator
MPGRRNYRDPCGIARALDLVGTRWALLVVRELILGPKRFSDLLAGLDGIRADVLAQRLRELEECGVVSRRELPVPAASRVYELTAWGAELEPALRALGRWGSRAPFPRGHRELGIDAFVVALRTLFDPERAGEYHGVFALLLDGQPFRATVFDGQLTIERGEAEEPDATIETGVAPLSAVLWHGVPLREAIADGTVRTSGSRSAARHFTRMFAVPVPVAA